MPGRAQACLILMSLTALIAAASSFGQESTAYQINRAHSGYAAFPTAPTFPMSRRWVTALPDGLSYPVIAQGRIYVLSRGIGDANGTQLFALDAGSGDVLWRRKVPGTNFWSAHTYGDGRLYVVSYDGLLRAFDPQSGATLWARQLPEQDAFNSPPTFSNGMVYVSGIDDFGSGGTVYGVNATDGGVVWTQSVWNGANSSPAASDTDVYVAYSCNQAYDFEPLTGALLWHHSTGCSGAGGKTTALAEFGLFTRDSDGNLILDRNTGHVIGHHDATYIPAFAGKWRYSVVPGMLKARRLGDAEDRWTFQGDGSISTAPIIVNDFVFVGSAGGALYALDRRSGAVAWHTNVGSSIYAPDERSVSQPLTGLGAGEGIIVVPAGPRLVAYGN